MMVLYQNNDSLMCKIFATTLQGEAQDWFHTFPPRSIRSFDDLSLVFTKEYSSYRSIKKKSNHLFNVKKNPRESLRDYVKRFKIEKVKIVECDNPIANNVHEQPQKDRSQKEEGKQRDKNKQKAKRNDRSPTKEGPTTKNYFKFSIPIHQIFRDIKNKPWFKMLKQSKGDTFKLEHTKYCAFHRGPGHTTDDCYTWKNYLEKLVKEGKVDIYLDKSDAQHRRNVDADEE
ncbi:unnamed protein product [Malus baccata var. baccata]